ncbi:hypothetical protein B0A50_00335 [Salinomyces thailandicus]|uniref:Amine oxidase domain-containing protein n=1 Tax=Salinomyces thailandicus TaxID=706561 RepID=A0A4U0UFM2_9PEZI|nr:hypothetical protein B0A50_00335 [Salinomyces thailandica]
MASNTTHSGVRHYETIVLGAGMSGLACASRLLQHSYCQRPGKLLVLEARDRIGGRIGSVDVLGNRLDTGANWIHGTGTKEEPNPLIEILPHKRTKVLNGMVAFRAPDNSDDGASGDEREEGWVAVNEKPHPSTSMNGGSRTSAVIPAQTAGMLMGSLWGMIGSLHEEAASLPQEKAKQTTMLQAIIRNKVLRSAFNELPEDLRATLSGMPQFIENIEAAPLATQSAEHERGRPGFSLLEFGIDDFDGEQVFLQDGYLDVVDEVAKVLVNNGLIEMETEVQRIRWDESPMVVETSQGVFKADRVVCTLPLGVLQHRIENDTEQDGLALFQPSLPKAKSTAVSSLGFGTLDKIFLVYSHPWWNEEPYFSLYKDGIVSESIGLSKDDNPHPPETTPTRPDSFMGFTSELPGMPIHPEGGAEPGLRMLSCMNLDELTGFPVLSTFVSCSNATYIESLSNEDAGAIIHRALTSWLGREPPKPDAVHVTRWAQDPYSLGSYSHMITGLSENEHRVEFQRPVKGKGGVELRFAGEHTSRNHFATVHGALLSGWREADSIIAGLPGMSQ